MSPLWILVLLGLVAVATVAVVALRLMRRRALNRWLIPYLTQSARRPARRSGPVHVLLAIADHYEPQWGGADAETARHRVEAWVKNYPGLFGGFRDADGRPPRHTFFFPIDEYDPEHLDALARLCRQGYGEIEIHHHHDHDTAEALRERLLFFKALFNERHGVLPRDRRTGALAYGFVHGNWALDNSRPDGRYCGVNNELDVLRETGCYADFTLPSAPDPSQVRKINSLYYAVDDPERPGSHETGVDVGAGPPPDQALLLIQGPLVLDWRRRKWGLVPRVENGCLQANQPARIDRLDAWLKARIQVPTRPDWVFVKLYTHGAPEDNQRALLGESMVQFHHDLARRAAEDPDFHVHYVSAREMFNLVKAAEAGWSGTVAEARDYLLVWDDARAASSPAPVTVAEFKGVNS
ncbi:MAG: hypothetical protein ABI353_02110 [Isosphaeraceae bacterium]